MLTCQVQKLGHLILSLEDAFDQLKQAKVFSFTISFVEKTPIAALNNHTDQVLGGPSSLDECCDRVLWVTLSRELSLVC